MKKTIAAVLMLALCLCASFALALEETVLPYGIRYSMTEAEINTCLENVKNYELYSDEDYTSYYLSSCEQLFGSVSVSDLSIEVTRNNSAREKQFAMMNFAIPFERNVIAAFRAVLAEFISIYGAPDRDPFEDISTYVEYGSLTASWTREDVCIVLNMTRLYSDSISGYINRRLCFDKEDLNE